MAKATRKVRAAPSAPVDDGALRKRHAVKRARNHKFKRLREYKRVLQQQHAEEGTLAPGGTVLAADINDDQGEDRGEGRSRRKSKGAQLTVLDAAQRKWQAEQRRREEARAARAAEVAAAKARAKSQRKERMATHGRLARRSARGQVLMKPRMERLLEQVERLEGPGPRPGERR